MPPKKTAKAKAEPKAKQSSGRSQSPIPKAKAKANSAKAKATPASTSMAPIQRPDPVTGELRNVTLVTPPVSSGDRVVQPLTDYWRSAFSDKRQKLSSGGDSGYGEASVSSVAAVAVATPPPPTVPTDVYAEVHDQTMDATAPPPTVPTAIDPLEEQSLLAELETQIMSPAPSQREEGQSMLMPEHVRVIVT